MDEEFDELMEAETSNSWSEVKSDKLFTRIQRSQKPRKRKKTWVAVRVASILLLGVMLLSLLYWSTHSALTFEPSRPVLRSYVTGYNQQNIFMLSDVTVIRMHLMS